MPESTLVSLPAVPHYATELATAYTIVVAAARVVRTFYDNATAATYAKADGSAVTDADLASDKLIRERLTEAFPGDAILTEEGIDDTARLGNARCWIADPIDGTDQFIRRTGDFDVLLALVVDQQPVVAASCNPASEVICLAVAGAGAWTATGFDAPLQPVELSTSPALPRLATSVWFGAPDNAELIAHIARELDGGEAVTISTGFSPRIFLDPRPIDAYVGIRRSGNQTMGWEWDFAAADLFIREAGGMVSGVGGGPYRYNQPVPRCKHGLAAARDKATHQRLVTAIATAQQALPPEQ